MATATIHPKPAMKAAEIMTNPALARPIPVLRPEQPPRATQPRPPRVPAPHRHIMQQQRAITRLRHVIQEVFLGYILWFD